LRLRRIAPCSFQHVDWYPADELAGPYEVA
jgi:hypothetical protein